MQIIPIFFSCNGAYSRYAAIAIKSLIRNASIDYAYRIYVLTTEMPDFDREYIESMSHDNFRIEVVNTKERMSVIDSAALRDYYSIDTYTRLFIPELYPEYDKVIYLDSDIIVKGDISEFFNIDITDKVLGACTEQVVVQRDRSGAYCEEVCGIDRHSYFNAGILLINCVQYRLQKVLERFFELVRIYPFVVTQDEDYLNVLCQDSFKFIGSEWNTEIFMNIPVPEEQAKIIHYIMLNKPWRKPCEYDRSFLECAKDTPFYSDIMSARSAYDETARLKDEEELARVYELVEIECARPDNYIKRVRRGEI